MEEDFKKSEEVQILLNTLPTLEMPPTFDNCNKMLGMYVKLHELKAALEQKEREEQEDGNDRAE